MTKKQMRKLAKEMIELEKVHDDPNSTQEAVAKAEKRIIQITNMLTCLPDGVELLFELDATVQDMMKNS